MNNPARKAYKTLSGKYGNIVLNTLYVTTVAVMFLLMPPLADDLWFGSEIYTALQGGSEISEPVRDTWQLHYRYDNSRLANVVFVIFLLLPKFVGNIVAIMAFGATLYISYRLISQFSERPCSDKTVLIFLFLVTFALPWYDNMALECYQFNYIISTFLALCAVWMFFNSETGARFRPFLLFLFGLIVGGWHEGFSVPVFFALSACIVLFKKYRNLSNILLLLGIVGGMAWIFLSPASLSRLKDGADLISSRRVLVIILSHPIFILLSVITAASIWIRRLRRFATSPLFICLYLAAVCSFCIHAVSVLSPRAGWWCEFSSILCLCFALNCLIDHCKKCSRSILARGLYISGILLIFAHWFLVDYHTYKLYASYDKVVADYKESSDGVVFAEFIPEYASPRLALMSPSFIIYHVPQFRSMFEGYFRLDKPLSVIPKELESATYSDGKPVGGNLGVREIDGFYFMEYDRFMSEVRENGENGEFTGTIGIGNRHYNGRRIFFFHYRNTLGEHLTYLLPYRVYLETTFGKISSIGLDNETSY